MVPYMEAFLCKPKSWSLSKRLLVFPALILLVHACAVDEIPIGAYQVQEQMWDGSVQMQHYLICHSVGTTFRGALVGYATQRAATCPSYAPLYAGRSAGKGPCAMLAPGWKMTTTCKNGDNQGTPPSSLPSNHVRYIGCWGLARNFDYAITEYVTRNPGAREELHAIKCCKVEPA